VEIRAVEERVGLLAPGWQAGPMLGKGPRAITISLATMGSTRPLSPRPVPCLQREPRCWVRAWHGASCPCFRLRAALLSSHSSLLPTEKLPCAGGQHREPEVFGLCTKREAPSGPGRWAEAGWRKALCAGASW